VNLLLPGFEAWRRDTKRRDNEMTQATPTEHSRLVGGSTAARRIGCPGSHKREQIAPRSKGSSYAREGTLLHEMIAVVLDKGAAPEDLLPFTFTQPAKGVEEEWTLTVDRDLWDRLGQPALDMFDTFSAAHEEAEGYPFDYMVEESGEFPGIPGAFGTSDVPFRCGDVAGIVDWKFGRNYVSPVENKQLMFYFAAMREKYPAFFEGATRVMLVICQPQTNDEDLAIWETTNARIDDYVLELQAAVQAAGHDDAPIARGPWCAFAGCKAVCELHVGAAATLAGKLDDIQARRDLGTAGAVTDIGDFLGEAMELGEMARDWAAHVAVLSQERLEAGLPVAGYKLVAKRSSGRTWSVPDEQVVSRLRSRGLKAAEYYVKKVITAPQAEKALKKIGKELPEEIVTMKDSTGFTLTREGDPRTKQDTTSEKAAALGVALLAKTKGFA
tara:strand:- start:2588 stop:3913 length:1326 start_codon:yes stop_codon:yes gene_type:complete